jgi:hypothetical protein
VSDEAEQPVTTADPTAVTDAVRMRRPSSLRAAAGAAAGPVGAPSEPASGPDSEPASGPDSAAVSASGLNSASDPGPRWKLTPPPLPSKLTPPSFLRRDSRPEAQPHSTDPVAADAGPPQKAEPSPSQKLVTLVSERPEVGLGIAFAAGLVIATILKRLAR